MSECAAAQEMQCLNAEYCRDRKGWNIINNDTLNLTKMKTRI